MSQSVVLGTADSCCSADVNKTACDLKVYQLRHILRGTPIFVLMCIMYVFETNPKLDLLFLLCLHAPIRSLTPFYTYISTKVKDWRNLCTCAWLGRENVENLSSVAFFTLMLVNSWSVTQQQDSCSSAVMWAMMTFVQDKHQDCPRWPSCWQITVRQTLDILAHCIVLYFYLYASQASYKKLHYMNFINIRRKCFKTWILV